VGQFRSADGLVLLSGGKLGPQISCRSHCTTALQNRGVGLFLSVFLGVSLSCLFTVMTGVSCMSSRRVGMVCALLMVSGVVVLGRFTMMVGSVRMMFRCLLVMFGCFLRHSISSILRSEAPPEY
jgi:hypothetical protein